MKNQCMSIKQRSFAKRFERLPVCELLVNRKVTQYFSRRILKVFKFTDALTSAIGLLCEQNKNLRYVMMKNLRIFPVYMHFYVILPVFEIDDWRSDKHLRKYILFSYVVTMGVKVKCLIISLLLAFDLISPLQNVFQSTKITVQWFQNIFSIRFQLCFSFGCFVTCLPCTWKWIAILHVRIKSVEFVRVCHLNGSCNIQMRIYRYHLQTNIG